MAYFGGNFAQISALCLGGDAHIINIGDSTSYENREWTCAHYGDPLVLFPLRWNYMIVGAAVGRNSNCGRNDGHAGAGATFTVAGAVRTEVDFGSWGPKLVRAAPLMTAAGNLTDDTALTAQSQGMQVNRMHTAVSNAFATQGFAWPLVNGIGRPWHHDSGSGDGYAKAKLVYAQHTSNQIEKLQYGLNRIGSTGTGFGVPTLMTLDLSESVPPDPMYGSTAWTAPVADAGNYQTTTSSMVNDHALQMYLRTAASYTETAGMGIGLVASVFARCDSGGTIHTNARGASCGYDAFGRSGCYVTDWANNYATATEWAQYFAATVLNPTGVTVMFIELGRNVLATTESTAGIVNSGFGAAYQTFINKLRSAYASAFPSGTLHICLIVPPKCVETSYPTSDTACNALQAAIEAVVAANQNCSWFSHWEYFGRKMVSANLHHTSIGACLQYSLAKRDAMDRATNFAYAAQGLVAAPDLRNR